MRSAQRVRPGTQLPDDEPLAFQASDLSGIGRYLLRRLLGAARSDQPTGFVKLLREHFGMTPETMPVVTAHWPPYDRVNVQVGLRQWLVMTGRSHRVIGVAGAEHHDFQLGDLLHRQTPFGPHPGSVTVDALSSGPAGETTNCVRCALYLVDENGEKSALLVRVSDAHRPGSTGVAVQLMHADEERASHLLQELGSTMLACNVFRGQVVTFGEQMFHGEPGLLQIEARPSLDRSGLVLPPGVLEAVERQVIGIAEHRDRLRELGQHLKRGLLLHGSPGTGKTHTIRYLLGRLHGVTVVLLSGESLAMLSAACAIARVLQPSVVVVEDVDLIAEERDRYEGVQPMLFELLNEMDGLGEDVDVAFLLTTNRPDLLEPALAARPGRVDQAVEIPLPDVDARRRLIELYSGSVTLDVADLDAVVERTEGVTASFIKELLRRSTIEALTSAGGSPKGRELRVTDEHIGAALDELLDSGNRLTRVMLGGEPKLASPPRKRTR